MNSKSNFLYVYPRALRSLDGELQDMRRVERYIYQTDACVLKIIENQSELLALVVHDREISAEMIAKVLDDVLEELFEVIAMKNSSDIDFVDALDVYEMVDALYYHHFGVDFE